MKYNYKLTNEFQEEEAREIIKKTKGGLDEKTNLPKIIVNSHEEMVSLLREASKNNPSINQRALDAIEKYDRTKFFNWDDISEELKKKKLLHHIVLWHLFLQKEKQFQVPI